MSYWHKLITSDDFAALLLSNGLLPFITDDEHLNHRLAYSLVLMNTGHSYEAVKELNSLIKKQPNLNGAYHARGAAYTRQGLEDQEMVNNALNDFNRAIELNRLNPLGWEQRGEKFGFAISDFLSTLKLDNSQPDAFHLVGVSFFHQGKLREATKSIQQAVKMNPNCLDCLQNLGQIYKELGDYDSALEVLNTALALLVEDTQTLYLRGMLQVEGGHVENALNDFQACTDIDPVNTACERMSAVCLTMMGQFYNAVKKTARVMTIAVDEDEGQERDKSMYTREISRYMHAHLDSPISELNMDYDLTARFREGWIRVLNFPIESYVEQPGIGPDISDVDQLGFNDFTPEVQNLICKGLALGNLNEHATDGFLTNSRESLALGLASIEVAQIARKIWRSQRLYKIMRGKDMDGRTSLIFQACYPDRPVLWLHLMPEHCIQGSCDSFNYQIVLLHGQTFNIRYESYLVNVMNATKKLLVQYLQETSDGDERFLLNLDEINNLEVLLSVMRKKLKDVGSGFIISNRISSHYRRAEKLEGVSFEVKEEKPGTLMFSMTSFTSKKRTDRYHAEMDHIWHQLTEEMQNFRKSANSPREVDFDSVGNLILTLVYYFYNLMPLSGGPSSIAYSVAIGLFIAAGRESQATFQVITLEHFKLAFCCGNIPILRTMLECLVVDVSPFLLSSLWQAHLDCSDSLVATSKGVEGYQSQRGNPPKFLGAAPLLLEACVTRSRALRSVVAEAEEADLAVALEAWVLASKASVVPVPSGAAIRYLGSCLRTWYRLIQYRSDWRLHRGSLGRVKTSVGTDSLHCWLHGWLVPNRRN
ncbi:putative tetratricopeptide repeat protein 13 [Apostichopus japonicus]|uniref:Putative tetratricopeptide repeat protein 13 n=1 Tax=Stichopus japonicus TaxID=307972 RepID=A0A2G8L3H9_STIJA|nr:putative tetratricopeptide repeat protein 13 [Apostichopus japonicus]